MKYVRAYIVFSCVLHAYPYDPTKQEAKLPNCIREVRGSNFPPGHRPLVLRGPFSQAHAQQLTLSNGSYFPHNL
jgi:hypothetical protein